VSYSEEGGVIKALMPLKVPLHCGSLGLPLHMGLSVNVHLILVPHALWESMTPTTHGYITSCSLFNNMGVLDSLHVRVHFLILFMISCTSLCMCEHPGLPLHKGMAFYNHMLEHLSVRWASWMPTAHRYTNRCAMAHCRCQGNVDYAPRSSD
jgi:hypothetical protein